MKLKVNVSSFQYEKLSVLFGNRHAVDGPTVYFKWLRGRAVGDYWGTEDRHRPPITHLIRGHHAIPRSLWLGRLPPSPGNPAAALGRAPFSRAHPHTHAPGGSTSAATLTAAAHSAAWSRGAGWGRLSGAHGGSSRPSDELLEDARRRGGPPGKSQGPGRGRRSRSAAKRCDVSSRRYRPGLTAQRPAWFRIAGARAGRDRPPEGPVELASVSLPFVLLHWTSMAVPPSRSRGCARPPAPFLSSVARDTGPSGQRSPIQELGGMPPGGGQTRPRRFGPKLARTAGVPEELPPLSSAAVTTREGAGRMRKYAYTVTCAVQANRPSSPEGFKTVTYQNPRWGQKCRFLGVTEGLGWSRLGMGPGICISGENARSSPPGFQGQEVPGRFCPSAPPGSDCYLVLFS
ncbi:uncharacterized protein LOC120234559 [Hyaena hyaena]|uniref:uncharacterized protein LOC120234559 n=1 Tax=Hyaena hyaena TaxID=95912 RepID=UPI00192477AF|nr:uncharacterized protein LOC120234559 [Hyaena hyaena]